MFSGILLSHGAIFSQMIPVRVERKGEEIIKKHQWDKALSVVTKKKYKVSNHLLGNVANLRQRKKKKKKRTLGLLHVEDAPRRGEISLIFTRYVQNNIQATFARRKPNWFPLFPGPAFPKLFHFYFVLFFFLFFSFVYYCLFTFLTLYTTCFLPSFLICKDLRNSHSLANYQTKFSSQTKWNRISSIFLII